MILSGGEGGRDGGGSQKPPPQYFIVGEEKHPTRCQEGNDPHPHHHLKGGQMRSLAPQKK